MMSIKTEGYLKNMGSLPNLHELERVRRRLEDEQELAKREQRAREERESIRDRERIPMSLQSTQSSHSAPATSNIGTISGGGISTSIINNNIPGPSTSASIGVGGGIGGVIAGGTSGILSSTHTTFGAGFGITAGNTHYGGYGMVGYGTPGQIPKYHHYHHHHRHSLTTRHRVMRTRSSGASYSIWDDPMIEHMTGYSPISSRSHRITTLPAYQVQAALAARRRESINSSIGANSIRRLLTLNNHRHCRHKIPSHLRSKICKNFSFLTISHGLICAILFPLIALQGSNSIWHHREQWIHVGPNIGSMLLSISFLISSGMCFLTTRLIRKINYFILLTTSYIGICIFLLCHLYPSIYTLVPAYIIFGIILGPSWISKMSLVVYYANKISCNQNECSLSSGGGGAGSISGGGGGGGGGAIDSLDPDYRISCNRDQKVRRLVRWFQVAQDIGIIMGAIIASIALKCTPTDTTCFGFRTYQEQQRIHLLSDTPIIDTFDNDNNSHNYNSNNNNNNGLTPFDINNILEEYNHSLKPNSNGNKNHNNNNDKNNGNNDNNGALSASVTFEEIFKSVTSDLITQLPSTTKTTTKIKSEKLPTTSSSSSSSLLSTISNSDFNNNNNVRTIENHYIFDMYNHNEHNERICGADMCPIWHLTEDQDTGNDSTFYSNFIHEGGKIGSLTLILVFLFFAVIALILTIINGKIDVTFRHENIKGMTDTLLFAGPMAYFIGTEQGYMLSDFSRAYVSCTLGLQMVAGVLICMGIMQGIVACTLSMLLRHIKRAVVLVAGFFFHACLLLVLSQWKPSKDDSALFYVIAASWGACNAMWETLLFALITLTHHVNVAEIIAPLQALRFLGLGVTFAAHGFLCENPKILILGIILVISLPPYAVLEIRLEAQRKSQLIAL
ncbi:uncharacterized protein LOC129611312 [Condylostylus longicornis]|uniref:uncharacterized protein LOC129611312 n=1 Tax=Condylostylus longicornis TaxID=2530218 RepID=UPI00244DC61F|nr:uncharacterized protein LOC129611312 [Condylostylus longicornis]